MSGEEPFSSVYELVSVGLIIQSQYPTPEFVLATEGNEAGADVVPEPAALGLLPCGLLVLAGLIRLRYRPSVHQVVNHADNPSTCQHNCHG